MRQLLQPAAEPESVAAQARTETPPVSLASSALRSFLVLLFLALIILGLAYLLKRWRKGRNFSGGGLVKVLAVEAVTPKHQIMLLDLLGEVLIIGVAGDSMTRLATVSDPQKIEELRLLRQRNTVGGGFSEYLKGFLNRERDRESEDHASPLLTEPLTDADEEGLPASYRDVLSQIQNRVRKNERSN